MEVQGGHIVRSTGRKDRHSKVCTAKGPRDRRVRLSAHTAIQFYDVQDRLGYDRPSKAVDWLIKKAKAAIDKLAELPPWNPETLNITANTTTATKAPNTSKNHQEQPRIDDREYQFQLHHGGTTAMMDNVAASAASGGSSGGSSGRRTTPLMGNEVQNLQHQQQTQMSENPDTGSSFLPPSLDSDAIADTIKSFFPMGASTEPPSSSIQFQSYPPDLLSRTSSQSQDLRLSLQSFQEPMLLQHQAQTQAHHSEPVLFPGTTPLGFDAASATAAAVWEHHHHHPAEIGRFQRNVSWNTGAETGNASGGGGGGFVFNSPPTPPLQPFFGQSQLFSQRGPLQSSNTPSIRAWIDQPITATDHPHHHHHYQFPSTIHPSAISGIGFASSSSGFSGFRLPARIQGEEEEHDGIPNKPSSASSDSRH